jgi:uncharacterized lipoprotein YmbA
VKSTLAVLGCAILLGACASSRPDHFYILSVQPQGAHAARTAPAVPATLKVTVPSLVDRSELILNTSADGVLVLEHERWAAPLADLVTEALARDIEQRRADLLVAGWNTGPPGGTPIRMSVDVVQMSVRRGGPARIEAHWRIFDRRNGTDIVGSGEFNAGLGEDSYAAIVQGFSECLGQLADRLVGQVH